MSAKQRKSATGLGLSGVAVMVLAIGAWTLPMGAEKDEGFGVAPTTEAEKTPEVSIGWVASGEPELGDVHMSVPLTEIQDGQFCQAYAIVHTGSSPYYFEWKGQFNDSHAGPGPLGPKQIVNGYIDEGRGEWLEVKVWEDSTKTTPLGSAFETLNIDPSYEYNESCEA